MTYHSTVHTSPKSDVAAVPACGMLRQRIDIHTHRKGRTNGAIGPLGGTANSQLCRPQAELVILRGNIQMAKTRRRLLQGSAVTGSQNVGSPGSGELGVPGYFRPSDWPDSFARSCRGSDAGPGLPLTLTHNPGHSLTCSLPFVLYSSSLFSVTNTFRLYFGQPHYHIMAV